LTAQLTYRLAEDKDLTAVLRLWERETTWGTLTPELWRRWYGETPFGRSLVVIAVDEHGEIAGQVIMTPTRVVVDEREFSAMRLSALALRNDVRGLPRDNATHPFIRLYCAAIDTAMAAGYSLVYGLPAPGVFPFFRRAGVAEGIMSTEYGCAAVSIPTPTALGVAGHFTARPVCEIGSVHDALWRDAHGSFPIVCGVVRSADWIRHLHASELARAEVGDARYLTLDVYDARDGSCVGYTAITTAASKKGSALLVDILARHLSQLAPVLAASLGWLATEPGMHAMGGIDRLTVMETPALQLALRALGFEPVDYTFAFFCKTLDPSLPAQVVVPERWYVMPGG
jgi:hypothetical protein